MSDSEESEDENVKLLLEAVDSNLLTDDLYKSKKDTIDTAEKRFVIYISLIFLNIVH